MDTKKEAADREQEVPDTTQAAEKNGDASGNEQPERKALDEEQQQNEQEQEEQEQDTPEREEVEEKEQMQEKQDPSGPDRQPITKKEDKTEAKDPHRGTAETPSQHTALDPEGERNNDTEEYKQQASGDKSGTSTEGQP